MNLFQKLLSYLYPVRMKFSAVTGLGKHSSMNNTNTKPVISFYTLQATTNNGQEIIFEQYRGKQVLLVNLASNCGYTGQYAELEELYHLQKDKLIILGFPANNFGGQEPGADNEIAEFCKKNYGISFPLFKKDHVKGEAMQPVYQWLTDPAKNGWNSQQPAWNFCKYLVNRDGVLTDYFSSAVSPLSDDLLNRLL